MRFVKNKKLSLRELILKLLKPGKEGGEQIVPVQFSPFLFDHKGMRPLPERCLWNGEGLFRPHPRAEKGAKVHANYRGSPSLALILTGF